MQRFLFSYWLHFYYHYYLSTSIVFFIIKSSRNVVFAAHHPSINAAVELLRQGMPHSYSSASLSVTCFLCMHKAMMLFGCELKNSPSFRYDWVEYRALWWGWRHRWSAICSGINLISEALFIFINHFCLPTSSGFSKFDRWQWLHIIRLFLLMKDIEMVIQSPILLSLF